jgi:hypothetical protein
VPQQKKRKKENAGEEETVDGMSEFLEEVGWTALASSEA